MREPPAGHRRAAAQCAAPARCREHACDGVFVAIGHTPVTELFAGQLPLDAEGYIVTAPDSTATASRACLPPATSRTRCSARR